MNQSTLRARLVEVAPVLTGLGVLAMLGLLVVACGGGAPNVEQGRQLYLTQGCAVCHGPQGRGDGPGAANLGTPPRDFQHPELFKSGRSIDAIARTLADGLTHPNSQMPAFPHLSETDRRHLAAYVLSIER
ncbi:MAG TPA: cytochrome c [Thermoanaerobaculia bacterium]|nr:cytochrome c [Thermoanaerobaculia bacterium]